MSGPSITTWNRLEPRPRSDSIARSLAAQVRDPLWILTRQWQFGEFQGEDAASPAWVQFNAAFSAVDAWMAPGSDPAAYDRSTQPLERVALREPFAPDDATAVELGQRFETLLASSVNRAPAPFPMTLAEIVERFRTAFPFGRRPIPAADADAQRFRGVCLGRALDGCALYEACRNIDLPPGLNVASAAVVDLIAATVRRWREWVRRAFGDIARTDPSTWNPRRLEYGVQVVANTPTGGRVTMDAHPDRNGAFDWYAFDERQSLEGDHHPTEQLTRNLLPIGVQFRGMPHARWWQFQDRLAEIGEIQPEVRELAKIVLMDFMFVHGNDWFVVPFTQPLGTLCRIERLLVHDVFGGSTLIDRADRQDPDADPASPRWSMFAISAPGRQGGLADYFILPPSAGSATLVGPTLESVHFVRDEMANIAWAIEDTTESAIGTPWRASERTRPEQLAAPVTQSSPAALHYHIESTVPAHWIPFVPVRVSAAGQVELERAAFLGPPNAEGDRPPILPVGRLLDHADPYRVREEEISRAGVIVFRQVQRTRWVDGSTHLWISRHREVGRGEGSGGLLFDYLEPGT